MLVGISPRWVVRLRGLAADQPLHIVNPARGLRVLLLLEHTGSLSAEETGGERVVPGKSQTQEIARPSFDGTETPSVPGPLLCQTNPPPNPVCTRKPCLAEPNPSPIRFCTGDHGLAEPNRNHRLAPHNSAKQTGAKASARRSLGQAAPWQTQDTHQTKQCQGNRRTPIRTSNAEASTRRANPSDQAAPGIQTEIASLNGDRRFQLQRSGTISSGPLKKLRVSCVHERDGKQVPCVRSLCSYARESRAC